MNMQWNVRLCAPPSFVLRIWVPKGWCICPGPRIQHCLLLSGLLWISHPHFSPSPRLSTKWPLLPQTSTCPQGHPDTSFLALFPVVPEGSVTFPDLPTPTQTQGTRDRSGGKFSVFLWLNRPPYGIIPSQVAPRQWKPS